MTPRTEGASYLLVSAGAAVCAIGLEFVVETMRAFPVRSVAGVQQSVLGAVVRGAAAAVVDLAALLFFNAGDRRVGSSPMRFVTLRTGDRIVAVAVDRVIGVAKLERTTTQGMTPLLAGTESGNIAEIATLDRELVFVLEQARLVDEATARLIEAGPEASP